MSFVEMALSPWIVRCLGSGFFNLFMLVEILGIDVRIAEQTLNPESGGSVEMVRTRDWA